MGLLLGQAGDRDDESLRALARAAWVVEPDAVVLKDLDGYLRGRQPGEVPGLLRAELIKAGAAESQIRVVVGELTGVRMLLEWSRAGDLLVLPVHALSAREESLALIAGLERSGWVAGEPLPDLH